MNGCGGFGNNEAQYYMGSNLKVYGGFLTIQARMYSQETTVCVVVQVPTRFM